MARTNKALRARADHGTTATAREAAKVDLSKLEQTEQETAELVREARKGNTDAQAELEAATKEPKAKVLPVCACGCGEQTKGGKWRPGHDAKWHAANSPTKANREKMDRQLLAERLSALTPETLAGMVVTGMSKKEVEHELHATS